MSVIQMRCDGSNERKRILTNASPGPGVGMAVSRNSKSSRVTRPVGRHLRINWRLEAGGMAELGLDLAAKREATRQDAPCACGNHVSQAPNDEIRMTKSERSSKLRDA